MVIICMLIFNQDQRKFKKSWCESISGTGRIFTQANDHFIHIYTNDSHTRKQMIGITYLETLVI